MYFSIFLKGIYNGAKVENLINRVGNGGIFDNQLNSIKRLITSRPSLQQYLIRRREDKHVQTTKHRVLSNHYTSQCANGSTECILEQLRARGLIRASSKESFNNRQQYQTKATSPKVLGFGRTLSLIPAKQKRYFPNQRGRSRYRPDCWTNDGVDDQAPPIDYTDYSDDEKPKLFASEPNRKQRMTTSTRRRRSSEASHPCLWHDDENGQ